MICRRYGRAFCARFKTRCFSSVPDASKIRNIGIAAHIDAGKTTTTERMLYYAGVIRSLGEVHKGDTVMDFMDQERARGITIMSAAITFPWHDHKLNLIDTPGHVDFTIEVEKALRVIDGAIAILDASAGVEAQTLTVWRQADRYNVPRLVFLNKMDKIGARFHVCLQHMENKLKCIPLPIQHPLGEGKNFRGVVDLVDMTVKEWQPEKSQFGKVYTTRPINRDCDARILDECLAKREQLVDKLADLDDDLASIILERESLQQLSDKEIESALRRVTLERKAFAVLCGSSYRNIGVQPLMDAVIRYLPDPSERCHNFVEAYAAGQNLCAMAFKIQNDPQRGPLTFLRIYSGTIQSGQKIYNVNRSKSEKVSRLYVASADELGEISDISQGNIVVVSGLKDTITGDTITSGLTAMNAARSWMATKRNVAEKEIAPVLAGIEIPDPVFFCSIEPPSMAFQKQLDNALEMLQKEDPSFKVKFDAETGQTIVSGMGELHLEILLERVRTEYKVDANLGPFQVAYKETASGESAHSFTLDRIISGTKHYVQITMSIKPDLAYQGSPALKLGSCRESREQLSTISPAHLKAVQRGFASSLNSGPLLSFPVTGVQVFLEHLQVGPRTSDTMITSAASQCLSQLMRKVEMRLLEPFMNVEVTVDERYLHSVLGDLAQHRSQVLEISQRHDLKVVRAESPLSELRGYSTRIRILTSGTAIFTMEFAGYKSMTPEQERSAIEQVTGIIS